MNLPQIELIPLRPAASSDRPSTLEQLYSPKFYTCPIFLWDSTTPLTGVSLKWRMAEGIRRLYYD